MQDVGRVSSRNIAEGVKLTTLAFTSWIYLFQAQSALDVYIAPRMVHKMLTAEIVPG